MRFFLIIALCLISFNAQAKTDFYIYTKAKKVPSLKLNEYSLGLKVKRGDVTVEKELYIIRNTQNHYGFCVKIEKKL